MIHSSGFSFELGAGFGVSDMVSINFSISGILIPFEIYKKKKGKRVEKKKKKKKKKLKIIYLSEV